MSFLDWYQNIPSYVSPIFFTVGFLEVRWYPLGYVFALFTGGLLVHIYTKRHAHFGHHGEEITDFLLLLFLGIVLGGRLGYVVFYQPDYYLYHLGEIFMPFRKTQDGWQVVGISGMSYHGGLLGFIGTFWLYSRYKGYRAFDMLDLYVGPAAFGYTFGRLGNFMNGELFGRKTDVPWGMYFKDERTGQLFDYLRHPSQLYEAFGEGILVGTILWVLHRYKKWKAGMLGSCYLISYGAIRFVIEFFRQPDHIFRDSNDALGVVFFWLTMGQVLSAVMVLVGTVLFFLCKHYSHESPLVLKTQR